MEGFSGGGARQSISAGHWQLFIVRSILNTTILANDNLYILDGELNSQHLKGAGMLLAVDLDRTAIAEHVRRRVRQRPVSQVLVLYLGTFRFQRMSLPSLVQVQPSAGSLSTNFGRNGGRNQDIWRGHQLTVAE